MTYLKPKRRIQSSLSFPFMATLGLALSFAGAGEAHADTYLYFRCNATGWGAEASTRMLATDAPGVVALDFYVNTSWMLTSGDDCELTQTDMPDGWGTQTNYYAFGTTGYVFQVPGVQQSSLVAGIDPHFKVRYPNLGHYRALFDRNTLKLTIAAQLWAEHGAAAAWQAVASSADGVKLVAVPEVGFITTSSDSGLTWTDRAPALNPKLWYSVASSANGVKLVAASEDGLYTSTDSGANWIQRVSTSSWYAVSSSADGAKLVALRGDDTAGYIYTSTNAGVSWTQRGVGRNYTAVTANTNDGTKLAAVVQDGYIYTSTDSGATWTERGVSLGAQGWQAVASSADGTKLVAVAYEGFIYTSTNAGSTWTKRGISNPWIAVTSSSDGTRLVAATSAQTYTSKDGGVTWVLRASEPSTHELRALASSADGNKLVAAVKRGYLYTGNGVFP